MCLTRHTHSHRHPWPPCRIGAASRTPVQSAWTSSYAFWLTSRGTLAHRCPIGATILRALRQSAVDGLDVNMLEYHITQRTTQLCNRALFRTSLPPPWPSRGYLWGFHEELYILQDLVPTTQFPIVDANETRRDVVVDISFSETKEDKDSSSGSRHILERHFVGGSCEKLPILNEC
ncbi:hypothetical protein BS17DRAFT_194112 [Gyrodon lividus]|nr:hypothetical protein BS17DRAFT_194112 [Gyrodon lividus]